MRSRRAVALAVVGTSIGCGETIPATAVVAVVGADEGVVADARRVRVEVLGGPSIAALVARHEEERAASFPFEVTLTPLAGDASRYFRIVVTALSGSDVVSRTQAASTFVARRVLALPLTLERCCGAAACTEAESCAACMCTPELVDARMLAPYGPARDAGALDAAMADTRAPGPDTASDAGFDASAADAPPPDAAPASDAISPDATCVVMRELIPVADTVIPRGSCGSISRGADRFANVGNGRLLLRFAFDEPLDGLMGPAMRWSLALTRDPNCLMTKPCPTGVGTLQVLPLRNDWVEGVGAMYDGADWCRRTSGDPGQAWGTEGASGAEDVGAIAGTADFRPATGSEATIELDPTALGAFFQGSERTLSLQVRGVADGRPMDDSTVIVAYTREVASPDARPRLRIERCAP